MNERTNIKTYTDAITALGGDNEGCRIMKSVQYSQHKASVDEGASALDQEVAVRELLREAGQPRLRPCVRSVHNPVLALLAPSLALVPSRFRRINVSESLFLNTAGNGGP